MESFAGLSGLRYGRERRRAAEWLFRRLLVCYDPVFLAFNLGRRRKRREKVGKKEKAYVENPHL